MINVTAKDVKFQAYGLVRDKNGKPKVDDYANCHDKIKALLTKKEREDFENGIRT